ncbi:MAG: DUF3467 domain-containing protein [Desulfobaccales bacterium]
MSGSRGSNQGESSEGRYANHFEVGFNAFEFLLDFGQLYMGEQHPRMQGRIVTSPFYARRLLRVLQRSIRQYEARFGSMTEEVEAEPQSREKVLHLSSKAQFTKK